MKRALLSIILIGLFAALNAKEEANWVEYTGRYIVALKNGISEVEVRFQNDGQLTVASPIGKIILVHIEKDYFEIPQYGGTVVFERDEKQEVTACTVSIPMADIKDIKIKKQ
jgi:hypothetical protein